MDLKEVRKRLAEFSGIRQNAGNDEAALLEVALFIEDTFGLVLSDEVISEENFGTHEATEQFVLKNLEVREACAESAE